MKKIIIPVLLVMCIALQAQEPEKKKDSKTSSSGSTQERSINETGISVKSKSQHKAASKNNQLAAPSSSENKPGEKAKDAKKPQ